MTVQHSAWMAARARNAARRGWWIAIIGSMSVVVTILVLIVLPNESDRLVRRLITALPQAPDTMPLVAQIALTRAALDDTAQSPVPIDTAFRTSLAESELVFGARTASPSRSPKPDSLASDLRDRILRARLTPLPDSYKALAASPLLRGSARVTVLVDSLTRIALERDAHAALGGPGAMYAALTTQLTAIGQRLIGVAEGQLAMHVHATALEATALEATALDAAAYAIESLNANTIVSEMDSAPTAARIRLRGELADADSALAVARAHTMARDSAESVLQQRLNIALPPFAMLIAAMVVGFAIGYAVVLGRELRRPTVSDAQEVKRFTGLPVFVHAVFDPGTLFRRATGTGSRRRAGDPPPLIDRRSEVFTLLHLALSGVGDAVSDVEVRAAEPVVSVAVAMGIAAAAVRESYSALLVESTRRQSMLAHYLGFEHTDDPHSVALGRDDHFDVWFGGPTTDAYVQLASRYDLRLHVVDRGTIDHPSIARDVIVCVRQGTTTLAWLARAMQHAKQRNQRVRAILLWSQALPAA